MIRVFGAAALLAALGGGAFAADHQVQMLNKGADGMMVFEPSFIAAEPGDTITFVPTDPGHDVASIPKMLPEGAASFESDMGKEFVLTVDKAGLWAVKCKPHVTMGMVALIQVGGDASNVEAIETGKLPKKARERMDAALAQAKR